MEKKNSVGKFLAVIAGLVIGGSLWLIPYWGYAVSGFANIIPVLFLTILGAIAAVISFGMATEAFEDTPFGPGLFLGTLGSILFFFVLLFTNNFVAAGDTIVWEDGRAEYVESERVYPFWNNDFTEVHDTNGSVSYEMDQRCEFGICTIRANVRYTVQSDFAVRNAGTIRNYEPLMRQALTEAIIRDEAYDNLEDLQTTVCDNFKANVGMDDAARCPINMRVSLNVGN